MLALMMGHLWSLSHLLDVVELVKFALLLLDIRAPMSPQRAMDSITVHIPRV